MKRLLYIYLMIGACVTVTASGQTLEECQRAAERNYPLKGWLPQVTATAQATYQSAVTSWPDEMQSLMRTMGVAMQGLKRDQYRVGLDVQQTVYDGGAISAQREVARRQGEVQQARLDVDLYAVRQRVNEMYFGLLMLDDQISLSGDLKNQLEASEKKLTSMVKHGTAAQCDLNSVTAERLNVVQQMTTLESQRRVLAEMLSAFCGLEVTAVSKPRPVQAGSGNMRPELALIDSQLSLADAQERALNSALLPRVGLFAQGYYGYPGYNMFKDMMGREWSWNGMVGARVTWNIGALYTRSGDKAKIELQRETARNQREVFLFNNRLEQMQRQEAIDRYSEDSYTPFLVIELGNLYKEAGAYDVAVSTYRDALSLPVIQGQNGIVDEFKKNIAYLEAVSHITSRHDAPETPFSQIPPDWLAEIEEAFAKQAEH